MSLIMKGKWMAWPKGVSHLIHEPFNYLHNKYVHVHIVSLISNKIEVAYKNF